MRYIFDITDNDDYKISGYFDEKVAKHLKQIFKATETKRNSLSVTGDYEPVEVFQEFLTANDVDISYNFGDYNDFLGSKVLELLFKIAYTDKEFSSTQINSLQTTLSQRVSQLPTDFSNNYPEIQLEDDYFLACLDEFSSKFSRRSNFDWYTFYRLIEDKVGNRESLRQIVKVLFMINFAKNVSKGYVAFVLSKFNTTPSRSPTSYGISNSLLDRLEVLAELEKLKKKEKEPSILTQKMKEREKLKKLLRAIGVSSPTLPRKSSKNKSGKIVYRIKDGKVVTDISDMGAFLSSSDESSSSD